MYSTEESLFSSVVYRKVVLVVFIQEGVRKTVDRKSRRKKISRIIFAVSTDPSSGPLQML